MSLQSWKTRNRLSRPRFVSINYVLSDSLIAYRPTQLEFVDIAGLVRGASKGEGLGMP